MFWSPAVTTLSVVCAAAGMAASASAAATRGSRRFIGLSLRWTCSLKERSARGRGRICLERETSCGVPRGKEEQRLAGDDDRRRRPFRHALGGVHPDVGARGAHAVTPSLADIDRLRDDAVDDETVAGRERWAREVRGVAAKVGAQTGPRAAAIRC